MIEHLMKSRPEAVLPPIVATAPASGEIIPEATRSDPRVNTAAEQPATPTPTNPSTLADRMATLPPPPVPRAVAPVPFSPGSEESHLVTEWVLTGCEVACRRCLGRWYVERTFSDGDVVLSCYSCRATVTGELYPGLAEDARAEKRRQREAEDAAIAGEVTT